MGQRCAPYVAGVKSAKGLPNAKAGSQGTRQVGRRLEANLTPFCQTPFCQRERSYPAAGFTVSESVARVLGIGAVGKKRANRIR